ncbi:hypothetical protein H7849_20420 [Alloacidobacterium dinghuense]|uniref:Uncharacterized protein n=1 Tax=Alloacidobacterium dinghuense TaxID=2763107 RepID=A0A7G8BFU7_9BACT|nr:hypothetical protein [Alloacidobacterium dinghuense]QNI31417.1 hypothetical protein H7849_20420 [Alloacidobacterium dinghuense]
MPRILKAGELDQWFNPDAITVINRANIAGKPGCEVNFIDGTKLCIPMDPQAFADYVSLQTSHDSHLVHGG